eukprot:CAMPEP_0176399464 /NCGR_PEP_ID=MMETSP0126-20121128/46792_1 /TAXON_ID=141414 ORGANISM="Strombidinopsis acuminatum, Strain SPMC142" /NCGR_SAMPLE_ID=MMETSP0126 /ASSEMBLY_ACC=CAM_ASM_000229 /LENGTH=69 /DNA_ID=CAMNT_0017775083 /DNA_START=248 /DNA_END=457 /DNA_ORIENTATION=+
MIILVFFALPFSYFYAEDALERDEDNIDLAFGLDNKDSSEDSAEDDEEFDIENDLEDDDSDNIIKKLKN